MAGSGWLTACVAWGRARRLAPRRPGARHHLVVNGTLAAHRILGGMDSTGRDIHLAPDELALARQRRGRLLVDVHVHVYEHGVVAEVGVPDDSDSPLDADRDHAEVAAAVARARDALASWR